MIKVFGHKSPDTDSVLSAIIYSWYSNNIAKKEAMAFVNGEPNNETKYVLDRFQVAYPEKLALNAGDEVVVVDTSNPEELPSNIAEAKILEIVDHHKMAGLATASPLTVTIRPVACTASLLYSMYLKDKEVDSKVLSLVLSVIISDTLGFRSPTTTASDKEIAEDLAKKLNIDIKELEAGMFAAKSDISAYNAKELLLLDSKVFQIKGQTIRISSLETTDPSAALNMKTQLIDEMKKLQQEENLNEVLFFVIDILKEEAHLIVATDSAKALTEQAFGTQFIDNVALLPGVVSRKKQIIPKLES